MAQHFPFNQHDLFWQFSTLVYASLIELTVAGLQG